MLPPHTWCSRLRYASWSLQEDAEGEGAKKSVRQRRKEAKEARAQDDPLEVCVCVGGGGSRGSRIIRAYTHIHTLTRSLGSRPLPVALCYRKSAVRPGYRVPAPHSPRHTTLLPTPPCLCSARFRWFWFSLGWYLQPPPATPQEDEGEEVDGALEEYEAEEVRASGRAHAGHGCL